MIISSVTSTAGDYLVTPVTTRTADNTAAINAQIAQDAQAAAGTGSDLDASASDAVDMAMIRAALDRRIDQDVASGTLSDSDAATVRLALDLIDAQSSAAVEAPAAQLRRTPPARGGRNANASDAAEDTTPRYVVTQKVTIEGPVTTTVTFYSDGTQDTTTTQASVLNAGAGAQQGTQADDAHTLVTQYLSTIEAGTLFNQWA